MNRKTILVLGGYGNTGWPLSRLLLQETDVQLVLAGRSSEKAARAAHELNQMCGEGRAVGIAADASDLVSLNQAFAGIDLVVVASSTARFARETAGAALEAGIDYLDIQYSTRKMAILKSMASAIQEAGLCFITDGGFHPGLPAVLVRYAGSCFDILEKANVGSVIKVDWASLDLPLATVCELLEEIKDFQPLRYQGSRWKKARLLGMLDIISMDFKGEFGKQYCFPMFLEEMGSLPEMLPTLEETGFFVGGFNWFVDWLVMPVVGLGLMVMPQGLLKPAGKLMKWGLETFSKPPYETLLKVEAHGMAAGKAKAVDITLSHSDGYLFTAIPVVTCLLQYLDGSVCKPGLWTQANLVEPARTMRDMQRMGVRVQIEEMDFPDIR